MVLPIGNIDRSDERKLKDGKAFALLPLRFPALGLSDAFIPGSALRQYARSTVSPRTPEGKARGQHHQPATHQQPDRYNPPP